MSQRINIWRESLYLNYEAQKAIKGLRMKALEVSRIHGQD